MKGTLHSHRKETTSSRLEVACSTEKTGAHSALSATSCSMGSNVVLGGSSGFADGISIALSLRRELNGDQTLVNQFSLSTRRRQRSAGYSETAAAGDDETPTPAAAGGGSQASRLRAFVAATAAAEGSPHAQSRSLTPRPSEDSPRAAKRARVHDF